MNNEEVSSTNMEVTASEFLQTMWTLLKNKEATQGHNMGELAVRVTFESDDGTTNRMILSRFIPDEYDYEDLSVRLH
jgi:hypothetical protein